MTTTTKPKQNTKRSIPNRYPILLAHIICEADGNFTAGQAIAALTHHVQRQPYYTKWYLQNPGSSDQQLLLFNKNLIQKAFSNRRNHVGCIADYETAQHLLRHSE